MTVPRIDLKGVCPHSFVSILAWYESVKAKYLITALEVRIPFLFQPVHFFLDIVTLQTAKWTHTVLHDNPVI